MQQYYSRESDSSENSIDKNNSDSNSPKRKPVSLACLVCKGKHMRCDGDFPCSNCVRKGLKCAYQSQPTRRGPIPGKVQELRKTVDQLSSELLLQRQKYQDMQEKYNFLIKKQTEASDISLSGHLLTTHVMDQIMKKYNDHIFPFIQVATPFTDFAFMQEKDVDSSQLLCMYACLLGGAMASGTDVYTDELFHRVKYDIQLPSVASFSNAFSRIALNSLHDKVDPYVCGTYHILSRSYDTFVEPEKASMCNATALHMSELLMKKHKVKEMDGVNLSVVRQVCKLNQALEEDKNSVCIDTKYSASAFCENILTNSYREGQIEALSKVIREAPAGGESIPLQTTILLHKIWFTIVHAMTACDKTFNTLDNIRYLFGMLKQAEAMAKKADPALTSLLMLRLNATYVVVSFLIGMDHASDLLAGKIVEAAENIQRRESTHIYFVVMPLFMIGQILAYRGDHLKVSRVVNVLKLHMAENVGALIESFSQLDCTVEFNKVSMYNEVLFFNHIHRFRQSNLMYGNSWSQFSESDILPTFAEEQRVPKIVELGAENPRVSPHSVSSTGQQPATKRARIDHQQYQVTATAPVQQAPLRTRERHAEYNVQSTVEYPSYTSSQGGQQYQTQVPSNVRPVQAMPAARQQQQPLRNHNVPSQQFGSTSPPIDPRSVGAQYNVSPPAPRYERQNDPRSYSEFKPTSGYVPSEYKTPPYTPTIVPQPQVELKYTPAISVNVTFNEIPQPRISTSYQVPPEYYQQFNAGYNTTPGGNVQQQQQAYFGSYDPSSDPYNQQVYYQSPSQPGQNLVNNDPNASEYPNYGR